MNDKPKEASETLNTYCDLYTVRMLEEWLELARSGEIKCVVLVGKGRDGEICWNWQGRWRLTEALGAGYYSLQALAADARDGTGDFDYTD